ncbi:MAG: hypothetical protein M1561_07225 [Gammaproteobacteria bacterium]|nr:hypothetical protein [Gammaproteobacteria bacterium]
MPDTDQKCVCSLNNTKSLWRWVGEEVRTIWCCEGPLFVGKNAAPHQIANAIEEEKSIGGRCCLCLALVGSPVYMTVIAVLGTALNLSADACSSLNKSGFFNCCHGGKLGYPPPERQSMSDSVGTTYNSFQGSN